MERKQERAYEENLQESTDINYSINLGTVEWIRTLLDVINAASAMDDGWIKNMEERMERVSRFAKGSEELSLIWNIILCVT